MLCFAAIIFDDFIVFAFDFNTHIERYVDVSILCRHADIRPPCASARSLLPACHADYLHHAVLLICRLMPLCCQPRRYAASCLFRCCFSPRHATLAFAVSLFMLPCAFIAAARCFYVLFTLLRFDAAADAAVDADMLATQRVLPQDKSRFSRYDADVDAFRLIMPRHHICFCALSAPAALNIGIHAI